MPTRWGCLNSLEELMLPAAGHGVGASVRGSIYAASSSDGQSIDRDRVAAGAATLYFLWRRHPRDVVHVRRVSLIR